MAQTLYLALGSAVSNGVLTELSGNAYARQPITAAYDAVTGVLSYTGATFPTATGTWTAGTTGAIFDAVSSGNLLFSFPLASPAIVSGATYSAPAASITLNPIPAATLLARTVVGTTPVIGASGLSSLNNVSTGVVNIAYSAAANTFAVANQIVTLTDGATITYNTLLGSYATVTIAATGRTLALTNGSPGASVFVDVVQDGTGSRTITTYTNVTWAAGAAPTLTTTAAAVDSLRFTWNPVAGKWRGETVGKAFA